MAIPAITLQDVGQAIQLALTPVFLVTGIAALLSVMTGRLARIIDRWRQLTESPDRLALREQLAVEFCNLQRRRRLAGSAITSCTLAALLICTVIVALFLEALLNIELRLLIGIVFTGGTFALVIGLGYFLVEVHLASTTVLFDPPALGTRLDAGDAAIAAGSTDHTRQRS
jgi:hypothetical protein